MLIINHSRKVFNAFLQVGLSHMNTQIHSCTWARYFSPHCCFCCPPILFTMPYSQAYVIFMTLFWFCNHIFHFNQLNHSLNCSAEDNCFFLSILIDYTDNLLWRFTASVCNSVYHVLADIGSTEIAITPGGLYRKMVPWPIRQQW